MQEKYPDGTNKTNNENYVGLTDTEFKLRYANHKQSFTKRTLQNATELSKYIWPGLRSSVPGCTDSLNGCHFVALIINFVALIAMLI